LETKVISLFTSKRDTMTEKELLFVVLAGVAALMFLTGFVLVLS
jgi:hypothetical protein